MFGWKKQARHWQGIAKQLGANFEAVNAQFHEAIKQRDEALAALAACREGQSTGPALVPSSGVGPDDGGYFAGGDVVYRDGVTQRPGESVAERSRRIGF